MPNILIHFEVYKRWKNKQLVYKRPRGNLIKIKWWHKFRSRWINTTHKHPCHNKPTSLILTSIVTKFYKTVLDGTPGFLHALVPIEERLKLQIFLYILGRQFGNSMELGNQIFLYNFITLNYELQRDRIIRGVLRKKMSDSNNLGSNTGDILY